MDLITLTDRAVKIAEEPDGPQMYVKNLLEDRDLYEQAAALSSFTELYEMLVNLKYGRLASSRGFDGDPEKLELVKNLRDEGKDSVKKLCRQFFFCSPEQMVEQLKKTEPMLQELVRLTEQFADEFAQAERSKKSCGFLRSGTFSHWKFWWMRRHKQRKRPRRNSGIRSRRL